MHLTSETIGGLSCRLVHAFPTSHQPRLAVILNHGFGAPGDDLVDLGPWLIESSERIEAQCLFVFPAAPVDMGPLGLPGGRAWWPINMAQLAEINQTGDYEQLARLQPPGMRSASDQLLNLIRELQQRLQMPESALVLGGFSQGAMVSTDVVLRHQLQPALLTLFSGTLLCRDEWSSLAADHPGCRVLQSHGRQDPILPLTPARQLHQLLTEAGFQAEFAEFSGPHTIPLSVLQRFGECLDEILKAD